MDFFMFFLIIITLIVTTDVPSSALGLLKGVDSSEIIYWWLISTPVFGLGVLVVLLIVQVALKFGGQSRVSHLRVVTDWLNPDGFAFASLIILLVFDLRSTGKVYIRNHNLKKKQKKHLNSHHWPDLSWLSPSGSTESPVGAQSPYLSVSPTGSCTLSAKTIQVNQWKNSLYVNNSSTKLQMWQSHEKKATKM